MKNSMISSAPPTDPKMIARSSFRFFSSLLLALPGADDTGIEEDGIVVGVGVGVVIVVVVVGVVMVVVGVGVGVVTVVVVVVGVVMIVVVVVVIPVTEGTAVVGTKVVLGGARVGLGPVRG